MRVASHDLEWESTLTWSKARLLNVFREHPEDREASYYKWTGVVEERPRLFYLGKIVDQYAHWRLDQPDHQSRIAKIRNLYPSVEILISTGTLETHDRDRSSRKYIDAIESLLIFVHRPEFNANKLSWIERSNAFVPHY